MLKEIIESITGTPLDRMQSAANEYSAHVSKLRSMADEARGEFNLKFHALRDSVTRTEKELEAAVAELRGERPTPKAVERYVSALEAMAKAKEISTALEIMDSVGRDFTPEEQRDDRPLRNFLQAVETYATEKKKRGAIWEFGSVENALRRNEEAAKFAFDFLTRAKEEAQIDTENARRAKLGVIKCGI